MFQFFVRKKIRNIRVTFNIFISISKTLRGVSLRFPLKSGPITELRTWIYFVFLEFYLNTSNRNQPRNLESHVMKYNLINHYPLCISRIIRKENMKHSHGHLSYRN